jgi:hypothetical protein
MALHRGMAAPRSCHGKTLVPASLSRSHRGGAPPRSCPPPRHPRRWPAKGCAAASARTIADAADARGAFHTPSHRPAPRPPGQHSPSHPARGAHLDVPGSPERDRPAARRLRWALRRQTTGTHCLSRIGGMDVDREHAARHRAARSAQPGFRDRYAEAQRSPVAGLGCSTAPKGLGHAPGPPLRVSVPSTSLTDSWESSCGSPSWRSSFGEWPASWRKESRA